MYMLARVLLGLMVLPVFILMKDTALDQVAGHHCLTDGSSQVQTTSTNSVSADLSNLCIDVQPSGKRTHLGSDLLAELQG